jgi:hypothetical protein
MTAAARTEQAPGTAVATQTPQNATAARIEKTRDALRERNQLVAAIRGTQWGRDTTPDMARAVAHYCYENGLDPVRHVEILGGRIYLTAELYDEKGAHLIRTGVVRPEEPDFINADERLDKLAKDGDGWAKEEITRRVRLRIQHNVPEKALAAVVQRFWIDGTDTAILGVNWCGGLAKKDPVGDAEPAKTALTRARRRAWKQIADVVPGYGEIVKPLEATAKIASEALPVSVVEPERGPKALAAAPADAPYGDAPVPPAQHSDDAGRTAEMTDELPLDDLKPVRRGKNALAEG